MHPTVGSCSLLFCRLLREKPNCSMIAIESSGENIWSRQHVLKQSHPDKSVYCLSRRGKKLASSEVSANLCKLIHATPHFAQLLKKF